MTTSKNRRLIRLANFLSIGQVYFGEKHLSPTDLKVKAVIHTAYAFTGYDEYIRSPQSN